MSEFRRYAVYYLPEDPALAAFGAAWLGWDVSIGEPVAHLPAPIDLPRVTDTPRKYGFHATLKPPFWLADGASAADLGHAVAALAAELRPVKIDGFRVAPLGHFLALVSEGDTTVLDDLAFNCVTGLDSFRAPPSAADLARRRGAGLTPEQDRLLVRWGYPYVGAEFKFHMTLSGRLDPAGLDAVQQAAQATLPPLPSPYVIASVTLVGEREDGMFQLIQRYALTG